MTTPHEQHNECQTQFVTYKWFSWAMASLLISLITLSVVAAVNVTEVRSTTINNKERIINIEQKLERKLDRIIELVRSK